MKKLNLFIALALLSGVTGMYASESDFERCLKTKKAFVSMCSTGNVDRDFIQYYTTKDNLIFRKALEACVFVKTATNYHHFLPSYQKKYEVELANELATDYSNVKKGESQLRCDQLRKDFVAVLASVQSEENKTAVIKAFESSLADCK